jgi:hypothetical protein
MSGRPLAITKRQAKTLLKAANEEGGIVEVKTDIGVVRLIPAVLARQQVANDPQVDPEPEGTM